MNYTSTEETFQQQALEIREPSADFDPSAAPQNGEEYLMHMLYERKKCPAIVVRHPQGINENVAEGVIIQTSEPLFPNENRPTIEWKSKQSKDFEATRATLMSLRTSKNKENENMLELPLRSDEVEWKNFCQENEPTLSIIMRVDQRLLEQLLDWICEWLGESNTAALSDTAEEPEDLSETCVDTTETPCENVDLSNSHAWLGRWLYATLVCLHLPLEPNVHSTLREIARSCIRLRSCLPDSDDKRQKEVPYNYFIHLIANVFGQLDFAEYV